MPRGPKGERRPADVIGNAVHVMKIATGEIEDANRDPATELHRKGGLGAAKLGLLRFLRTSGGRSRRKRRRRVGRSSRLLCGALSLAEQLGDLRGISQGRSIFL